MPKINAEIVLGADFSNFSLIDVPRNGNCGISAVLVASGILEGKFPISNEGQLLFSDDQLEQVRNLRQQAAKCVLSLPNCVNENSTHLVDERMTLNNGDFTFVSMAMQRPIVLVQPSATGDNPYTIISFSKDGNETKLTSDQTPEQLLAKNPETLFIYFNGINHYQALKQKDPSTCCPLQ